MKRRNNTRSLSAVCAALSPVGKSPRRRLVPALSLAAASVVGLFAAPQARAVSLYWDASSTSATNWDAVNAWNTSAYGTSAGNGNWASGDVAYFNCYNYVGNTASFTANLDIATTVAGITFNAGNATLTGNLVGVNGMTLTAGITVNAAATGNNTLSSSLGNLTLGGNYTFTNNGTGVLTIGANLQNSATGNNTLTMAGSGQTVISGVLQNNTSNALALTVSAGNVTLNNTNTFTGATLISGGTLALANTAALAATASLTATSGTLDLANDSASTFNYNPIINANSNFTLETDRVTSGSPGITQTLANISLTATGTTTGITVAAGPNVSGGTPVLAIGNVTFTTPAGVNCVFSPTTANLIMGNFTGAAGTGNTSVLTLAGTAVNSIVTGAISNGAAGGKLQVNKSGAGTWILAGNNTYTWYTNVTAGTLQLGNGTSGSIGNTASVTIGCATLAGNFVESLPTGAYGITGTTGLSIYGGNATLSALNNFTGGTSLNGGNLNLTIAGALSATYINTYTGSTLTQTVPNAISGNTSLTINTGTGTNLSLANNNTGGVVLTGGTLYVGNASAMGTGYFKPGGGTLVNETSSALTIGNPIQFTGNLTVGSGGDIVFSSGPSLNSGNRTLTINNGNTTFSGGISGTGFGINVGNGSTGNLILSGSNTYTGLTNVNGGNLKLATGGSLGNTSVTVNSGAAFTASAGTSIDSAGSITTTLLTLASGSILNLNDGSNGNFTVGGQASLAGATLNFDLGNASSSTALDYLRIKNAAADSGANTIAITSLSTSLTLGNYTLITAASGLSSGNFTLGNATIAVGSNTYKLALNGNGSAEVLTVSPGYSGPPTWTGNSSNAWDTTSANWITTSGALYGNGMNVVFDDTGNNTNPVNVTAGITPGSLTFNNNTKTYVFTGGQIGGNSSTTLTLNGNGMVIMENGNNTFAGNITINAGTLQLGNGASGYDAAVAGNITNNAALAFNLFGNQTYTGAVSGNGTTTVGGSGALAVSGVAQSNLVNNGTLTLNGTGTIGTAISGTGNLTVSGMGALTAGNFAQTGLIDNGTVQINGTATIGQLTGSGNLTIGTGSSNNTVQLVQNALPNSFTHTQQSVTISSGSTLDITNNTLLLNYGSGSTPLAAVQAAVASGAITSSTVSSGSSGQFAVGYADSTELGSVPSGNVEVMFTLAGDANLDGVVNFNDFSTLQNSYNQTGRDWSQGDFNNDGIVNFNDYSILQNNYGQTLAGVVSGASIISKGAVAGKSLSSAGAIVGAALAANGLAIYDVGRAGTESFDLDYAREGVDGITAVNGTDIAVVPEPASMSLLLLGGLPVVLRRRRRRS